MSNLDDLKALDSTRKKLIASGYLPTPRDPWHDNKGDTTWLAAAPAAAPVAAAPAAAPNLAAILSHGYGIEGALIKGTLEGPSVTTTLVELPKGSKAASLATREADLARDLGVDAVRVLGSMPGYPGSLGIEIPNAVRKPVGFTDTLQAYKRGSCKLPLVTGATSTGHPITLDLAGMPHLLVAGTTGSGKSVFLHAAICSLATLLGKDSVRLHLVDPKRVELRAYRSLPHLAGPIATEPAQAQAMLLGLAAEMDRRYKLLEETGARDIEAWNASHAVRMTREVLIVDEYGDLMMQGGDPKALEDALIRIAQKARAVGIHAIIATQKLTGVVSTRIRENFPVRATFRIADERTTRKTFGPEDLLGKGDLLLTGATPQPRRIQAAYLDPATTQALVKKAGG